MVRDYILSYNKDCEVELLTMKTTGDKILDRTLDKVGGKGLFVKELDKALLEKKSQLSVHSLKDMPMEVVMPVTVMGIISQMIRVIFHMMIRMIRGTEPTWQVLSVR